LSIKNPDGSFTREFNLWADKLDNRSPDEIAQGFEYLERRVKSNYENGKENWPPSYAEFAALCKPYQYKQREALLEDSRIELTEEQIEANKKIMEDSINELKEMFK
jgi:hypothetical protein